MRITSICIDISITNDNNSTPKKMNDKFSLRLNFKNNKEKNNYDEILQEQK
ncbi:hypothetical protein GCM10023338_06580 [Wohlfahrtiimonas larvae]|uniref:Uncharacterized protein n=1 Tax=Wohlfahrtiimonas larvae TaxID=1157986 RepID=A0ABP9MGC7_9GAMM